MHKFLFLCGSTSLFSRWHYIVHPTVLCTLLKIPFCQLDLENMLSVTQKIFGWSAKTGNVLTVLRKNSTRFPSHQRQEIPIHKKYLFCHKNTLYEFLVFWLFTEAPAVGWSWTRIGKNHFPDSPHPYLKKVYSCSLLRRYCHFQPAMGIGDWDFGD